MPAFLGRTVLRVKVLKRAGNPVTDRTGLAGQSAALHRADDVEMTDAANDQERLVQDQALRLACEINSLVAAIDRNLPVTALQPHTRNGVLTAARCIRTTACIDFRLSTF